MEDFVGVRDESGDDPSQGREREQDKAGGI